MNASELKSELGSLRADGFISPAFRLHRTGEIDDETLHELERDLDLEELSAISAKA